MPLNVSTWWTDPLLVRIVSAVYTQLKDGGTGVSTHATARAPSLTRADASLLRVVCLSQTRALYVETERTVASTYNVGLAKGTLKTHSAAVIAAIAAAPEDFSSTNFDQAAAKTELLARYNAASTPFSPADLERLYPPYRKGGQQQQQQPQFAVQVRVQHIALVIVGWRKDADTSRCLLLFFRSPAR